MLLTPLAKVSPLPRWERVGPAPRRVQDNALNLTWFRGWGDAVRFPLPFIPSHQGRGGIGCNCF